MSNATQQDESRLLNTTLSGEQWRSLLGKRVLVSPARALQVFEAIVEEVSPDGNYIKLRLHNPQWDTPSHWIVRSILPHKVSLR